MNKEFTESVDRIVHAVQLALGQPKIVVLPSPSENVKQVFVQKPNGDQIDLDDIVRIRNEINRFEPHKTPDDYTREWQGVGLSPSDPVLEPTTEYSCIRFVDDDASHIIVRTFSIIGAVHIYSNHA